MKYRLIHHILIVAVASALCAVPIVGAQTSESDAGVDKPRNATSDSQYSGGINGVRRSESHEVSGNRSVDRNSLQRVGPDGRYEPYMDVETETVKVNASTTRTVTRTFGRGANGEKTLVQVTEQEKQDLPGGGSKSVQTTSNPDAGGRLQMVQREVRETKNLGQGAQETKSTLFMGDLNGNFAPVSRSTERQTQTGANTSQVRKSVESRDVNGSWQVTETREGTVREVGKERTTEETVSRADANGKLSVAGRTVGKESTDKSGDTRSTVETYSNEIPGSAPDGSLHLNQRVTTVKKSGTTGTTTERQVEERNPGSPQDGLRTSTKTIDIVRAGPNGNSQTRTTQTLNGAGSLATVEVDTGHSDPSTAVKVEIAPSKNAAPAKKAEAAPAAEAKPK